MWWPHKSRCIVIVIVCACMACPRGCVCARRSPMRIIELSQMPCLIYIDIACRGASPLSDHTRVMHSFIVLDSPGRPPWSKNSYANFQFIVFALLLLLPLYLHSDRVFFMFSILFVAKKKALGSFSVHFSFSFECIRCVLCVYRRPNTQLKPRSISMRRTMSAFHVNSMSSTVLQMFPIQIPFPFIRRLSFCCFRARLTDDVGTWLLVLMVKRESRAWMDRIATLLQLLLLLLMPLCVCVSLCLTCTWIRYLRARRTVVIIILKINTYWNGWWWWARESHWLIGVGRMSKLDTKIGGACNLYVGQSWILKMAIESAWPHANLRANAFIARNARYNIHWRSMSIDFEFDLNQDSIVYSIQCTAKLGFCRVPSPDNLTSVQHERASAASAAHYAFAFYRQLKWNAVLIISHLIVLIFHLDSVLCFRSSLLLAANQVRTITASLKVFEVIWIYSKLPP